MTELLVSILLFLFPGGHNALYEDGSYRVQIGTAVEFSGCIPTEPCSIDYVVTLP